MLAACNRGAVCVLHVLLVTVFGLLVVDVLIGVGSRYLIGNQVRWSEELARLLMVWLALLGAALASRRGEHLGLDVVVRQWPEQVQRIAAFCVHLLVFVFALAIMVWGGGQLVLARFESGQMLPALHVSRAWFYLALPVSGVLISLFSCESMLAICKSSCDGEEGV